MSRDPTALTPPREWSAESPALAAARASRRAGFKADANSAPQALPDCAVGGAAGAGTGGAAGAGTGGSAGSSAGGASASGSGDDGGCSTAPGVPGSSAPWLALGAAVAAALRRRRAAR